RRQRGDVGPPELARHLGRAVGPHDGARVDERVRHVELVRPLDEEGTLLRVEEGEARVGGDLRRVGLDLREVRLHGAVEHEIAAERPAYVAADLRIAAITPSRRAARTARAAG